MKKTMLSVAIVEIIISCGMQSNAYATTINNTNYTDKNIDIISAVQKNENVLSVGSKGDIVRNIQRLLNYIEDCNVKEDGVYGLETYNAIIKYQAKNGLKQDGIVGKQTAAKLLGTDVSTKANSINLNVKNGTEVANVKTVEEKIKSQLNSEEINSNTDYFIAVSKSQRQVYIYHKENNSWVNIKVFICNMGEIDGPTIDGDFSTGLKGKFL